MGKEKSQFKKGQSGNPGGRPLADPEVKAARELTAKELASVIEMVFAATVPELTIIAADPKEPFVRSVVAKCCVIAHRTGDWTKVDSILNRAIGKVSDSVQLTGKNGGAIRFNDTEAAAKLAALFAAAKSRADK